MPTDADRARVRMTLQLEGALVLVLGTPTAFKHTHMSPPSASEARAA